MKKLFNLSIAIIVSLTIFIGCDKDNENFVNENEKATIVSKSTESEYVGKITEDGKFVFLKDQAILLENWNYNLLTHYGIDAQLTSLHFFKDDLGDIYLRAQGVNYGSTAAISFIDGFLKGEGITCTSNTCSGSSTECIPKADKKSCTKCGWGVGDCSKAVSAVAIFDKQLLPSEIY